MTGIPGGRRGDRAADPGDDLDRHPGGTAGDDLLAAASEHERVATLQPGDGESPLGPVDDDRVDLLLGAGVVAGTLSDIYDLGVLVAELCEVGGAQAVVDEYVGGCQEAVGADGEQVGRAGAAAYEVDGAGGRCGGLCGGLGRAASRWVSSTRRPRPDDPADRLGLGEPVAGRRRPCRDVGPGPACGQTRGVRRRR